jgi:hypothetical protein
MSEQLVFLGYVEGWVIADGAVSDSQTFKYSEGKQLDDWLRNKKMEAMSNTARVEIFLLSHDHPTDVEDCACAQYLTDHHPFWKNYIRTEIKEEGHG